MVYTHFNHHIKILRTDGTRNYLSLDLHLLLTLYGTLPQLFCPYTLQQNGVTEHKHHFIFETARVLLHNVTIPRTFWVEAILTSIFLINITPSSVLFGCILY